MLKYFLSFSIIISSVFVLFHSTPREQSRRIDDFVVRTSDSLVTEQHKEYNGNYMYRLPSRTIIIAAGQAVFFLHRSVYCAILRTEETYKCNSGMNDWILTGTTGDTHNYESSANS